MTYETSHEPCIFFLRRTIFMSPPPGLLYKWNESQTEVHSHMRNYFLMKRSFTTIVNSVLWRQRARFHFLLNYLSPRKNLAQAISVLKICSYNFSARQTGSVVWSLKALRKLVPKLRRSNTCYPLKRRHLKPLRDETLRGFIRRFGEGYLTLFDVMCGELGGDLEDQKLTRTVRDFEALASELILNSVDELWKL